MIVENIHPFDLIHVFLTHEDVLIRKLPAYESLPEVSFLQIGDTLYNSTIDAPRMKA